MMEISTLKTELKNERTEKIDMLATRDILRIMNEEDKKVPYAVEEQLDKIEKAVEIIYHALSNGGRLIYCGCGTSGRLGILDAAECPPTFGTDPELVQAIMAGGASAFVKAVEGAEDNELMGQEDLKAINLSNKDVLVGISASGRTPYVIGAVKYAASVGAKTISLTCCPDSILSKLVDVAIEPETGPEVITGSTRLKGGTAQKLVLNMLSTTVMIKLGKVYSNLMVDMKATNSKLKARAVSIVMSSTGVSEDEAKRALLSCDYSVKTAIVMIKRNCGSKEAEKILAETNGNINAILEENSGL